MSLLVGLTGCMGAGKSLAASFFLEQGAYIIDADAICRQLVEPGKPAGKKFLTHLVVSILIQMIH